MSGVTSYNDFTSTGVYDVRIGDLENAPTTEAGLLMVIAYSNGRVIQIFTDDENITGIYYRKRVRSSWGVWKTLSEV